MDYINEISDLNHKLIFPDLYLKLNVSSCAEVARSSRQEFIVKQITVTIEKAKPIAKGQG